MVLLEVWYLPMRDKTTPRRTRIEAHKLAKSINVVMNTQIMAVNVIIVHFVQMIKIRHQGKKKD